MQNCLVFLLSLSRQRARITQLTLLRFSFIHKDVLVSQEHPEVSLPHTQLTCYQTFTLTAASSVIKFPLSHTHLLSLDTQKNFSVDLVFFRTHVF